MKVRAACQQGDFQLNATPAEDRIRAIAHELWLKEGQPDGRAEAHWLKANELVNAEAQAQAAPAQVQAKPTPAKAAAAATKTVSRKR